MNPRAPDTLPLLAARDLDAPLAWRQGRPVSGRLFLADALRQAELLPARGPAVNLCADRYAFAVGLAAALLRGKASLLPPNARPDTLAGLSSASEHAFAWIDDPAMATAGLPKVLMDGAQPAEAASVPVPAIASDLHAVSLLTSGSTGIPQAHAKSWATLVGDVAAAVARLCEMLGRQSLAGMTFVATVPVQHSYGLESSALLGLLGGAAFENSRPFYPADIVATLLSVPQPRALVTTPFHLKTLLASDIDLPAVDLILSATAPLSPQLAAQAENLLGGPLIEIYGSTESGQVATRRTTQTEGWHTLGEVEVHRECDQAGVERFVFSGDFIPRPMPIGDTLELLDSQHFRLLGRVNDLIHVAGRRTSLGHLNYHLNSIAGVEDGAFWLPDDVNDGVVRPVAFVVAPTLSAASIIAALRQRLESVFVPRRIVHVAALPREATGKLPIQALREFARAQLAVDGEAVQFEHTLPVDLPVFAGHFPGQPLLPGAMLLSQLLDLLQQVPALWARLGPAPTLAAAKFLAPLRPGDPLRIEFLPESGNAGVVRFNVRRGDVLAATGRWIPHPTPSHEPD